LERIFHTDHCSQGLHWLLSKEDPQPPQKNSDDTVQLWKRDDRGLYVNLASNFVTRAAPTLMSGGILADDMGLGKTLQMIALMLEGGTPGPTLIVAPVAVMSNWEQQIRRHVAAEHMLSVIVYHGAKKCSAEQLAAADVVITSYGKVSAEKKAGSAGVLMAVDWRRVVLDEGHTIRNSRTETALAACLLRARSRWVLSGTPIVNNVRDLHSQLKFLRITGGLEHVEIFNAVVARPLGEGDRRAEAILQNVMRDVCLRRRKDMKFVDLKIPQKTEYLHRVTFLPDEQKKYDALL
jgi:SWI/SNF-related matrix-associated actin-dependent regulator of chromatin subfamily A3